MFRIAALLLVFTSAAIAGEAKLGDAKFKFSNQDHAVSVLTQTSDSPATDPALLLKFGAGNAVSLQSRGLLADEALKKDEPIAVSELQLDAKTRGLLVSFTLLDSRNRVRAVAALLRSEGSEFKLVREWTADCEGLGEAGFIRQKQTFSAKIGIIARELKNTRVEGIMYTLDCGCPACASRTTEFRENETWTWNAEKQSLERSAYEKRYIVQPTEGLLSVARKAYGDAKQMARLLKLNPELKNETMLKEGQGIVVEREGTSPQSAQSTQR